METPQKINHDFDDILWSIIEFIIRNSFGILSALAGFVYQIYQMSGKKRNLTRVQCIFSVILWAISGIGIVIGLNGVEMNRLFYGAVCWATPIVIKPFADKVAEHAPTIGNKIMKLIESLIDNIKKDRNQ